MWPIISNRDVLAVNQRWVGHPGTRLGYTGAVNGNVGNSSQVWAKPLGNTSFAVFSNSTPHSADTNMQGVARYKDRFLGHDARRAARSNPELVAGGA